MNFFQNSLQGSTPSAQLSWLKLLQQKYCEAVKKAKTHVIMTF